MSKVTKIVTTIVMALICIGMIVGCVFLARSYFATEKAPNQFQNEIESLNQQNQENQKRWESIKTDLATLQDEELNAEFAQIELPGDSVEDKGSLQTSGKGEEPEPQQPEDGTAGENGNGEEPAVQPSDNEPAGESGDGEEPEPQQPDNNAAEEPEKPSDAGDDAGEEIPQEPDANVDSGSSYDNYNPGDVVTIEIDENNLDNYFILNEITDVPGLSERIQGKIAKEEDFGNLRHLKLLHYNFTGQKQVGELIVAKELAETYRSIFKELYQSGYQLNKVGIIEDYWPEEATEDDADAADTKASDKNITFCDRDGQGRYGYRLNINPEYNPIVERDGDGKWIVVGDHPNAEKYADDRDAEEGKAHMIAEGDSCYNAFDNYGFEWKGKEADDGRKRFRRFDYAN